MRFYILKFISMLAGMALSLLFSTLSLASAAGHDLIVAGRASSRHVSNNQTIQIMDELKWKNWMYC